MGTFQKEKFDSHGMDDTIEVANYADATPV